MTAMLTSLALERASFRTIDCPSCQSRALVYFDFDAAGEEIPRCLQCNAQVPAEGEAVRLATPRSVESMGYVFMHRAKRDPRAQKLSGCGAKGVKSCGTGGCSSGSCGTGGGGCGSGGGGCG